MTPDTRTITREVAEPVRVSDIKDVLLKVVDDLLAHSGHGTCDIRMRWVGKGLKEVCIQAGKEHRFVVRMPLPISTNAGDDSTSAVEAKQRRA